MNIAGITTTVLVSFIICVSCPVASSSSTPTYSRCPVSHGIVAIPYDNKIWRKTKFGELANHYQIAKFKFHQYYFHIIIISIATLQFKLAGYLQTLCSRSAECILTTGINNYTSQSACTLYKNRARSRNLPRNVSNYIHTFL